MLFKALIIALFIAVIRTIESITWVIYCQPFITSSIVGLILGNWEAGVTIGATIQLVYMGQIAVGGITAYSYIWAGVIGPAVAIVSGMTPEEAITICVAIGALGIVTDNIRMTVNSIWVHMADRDAEKGISNRLWMYALLFPFFEYLVIYGIPAIIAIMFGATYLQGFMESIPLWLKNGITGIGKLLPALGIGMMLKAVYNRKFVAFAIIGYILVGYFNLPTIGVALVGLAAMLIYWTMINEKEGV